MDFHFASSLWRAILALFARALVCEPATRATTTKNTTEQSSCQTSLSPAVQRLASDSSRRAASPVFSSSPRRDLTCISKRFSKSRASTVTNGGKPTSCVSFRKARKGRDCKANDESRRAELFSQAAPLCVASGLLKPSISLPHPSSFSRLLPSSRHPLLAPII